MGAMFLPTLAGIARMVPIRGEDNPSNVGANWGVNAFTVPTGRVLALDWAGLQFFSGTAPLILQVTILSSAGGGNATIVRRPPPALNTPAVFDTTVWIEEAGIVNFGIAGGDATTDMLWVFAGRLFDWVDVT